MAQLPRMLVHVVAAGSGEPVAEMDMTSEMLSRLQSRSNTRALVRDRAPEITGMPRDASLDLHQGVRDGTLVVNDFFEAADAFLEQLPSSYEVRLFSSLLDKTFSLEAALVMETEKAINLAGARWEPDATTFDFVYDQLAPGFRSGYSTTAEAMGDGRVAAAFGTVGLNWKLPVRSLREVVADEMEGNDIKPDVDQLVSEFIENEMADQYEDAEDDIVDLDGLQAAVEAWLPHAGSGSPEDLALDAAIASWNAKQTITSYMVDFSVAAPLVPGLTQQVAIEMAQARVSSLEQQIQTIRNGWPASVPVASMAPTP